MSGAAVEAAADRKTAKYAPLTQASVFMATAAVRPWQAAALHDDITLCHLITSVYSRTLSVLAAPSNSFISYLLTYKRPRLQASQRVSGSLRQLSLLLSLVIYTLSLYKV